ncbi:tyrosine-type recombinase/integrase [Marinobacterium aestuariivivens]|uniref:Tyrosine-type recombinase/integrase n=1 Tax=Marinobacterium aestuariivivens TaxID=1698799 RepID=A0ABW2A2Y0_9GAMM
MARLTDKAITAKVDKTTWLTEDAPKGHGRFSAKLTPTRPAAFYFRYTTADGKRDYLPLGYYDPKDSSDGLTLKQARAKSAEMSRLYQSGILNIRQHIEDEEAHRKAQQAAELARLEREEQQHRGRKTVAELFEHWAAVDLIRRKDAGAEMRRLFNRDILPLIGTIAAEDIRKRHVTEVTDALLSRGVPRMAKVAFSSMRQMFRFAVDRDIVEADPTAAIRKVSIGGKDTERDRILSDDEIRLLHQQMPEAKLLPTTETAVWLALATCCRIGELLRAEWQHVDLEKHEWLIPAENSKNGKSHSVSLSEFAIQHFRQLHRLSGSGRWCYPNRHVSDSIDPRSITKQLTDRQVKPGERGLQGEPDRPTLFCFPAASGLRTICAAQVRRLWLRQESCPKLRSDV